jgi:DNA polymerase-4
MNKLTSPRKIIHIDMDCFYAAIEIRENPSLANLPVAVGGSSNQRGVLCTCNYVARKFGLHSAMSSAQALKLCPDLILLPVNMPLYKQVSQRIQAIFHEYSDLVEPLSLDEAYLDVSLSSLEYGSATQIAELIRQQIWQQEQLTASAGVSVNKFIAKVASGWHKPNGICIIPPNKITEFVNQLPVNKLFGVGKVMARKLEQLNIKTCRDLHRYSQAELCHKFGKFGTTLYYQAKGIDHREVNPNRQRKSLSVETTFNHDVTMQNELHEQLNVLLNELLQRLNKAQISTPIKAIFLKLKFKDFTATSAESSSQELNYQSFENLLQICQQRNSQAIRLLGLGVTFNTDTDLNQQQLKLF